MSLALKPHAVQINEKVYDHIKWVVTSKEESQKHCVKNLRQQ